MKSNGEGKPEPADPEDLVRMMELELVQKRAARQHVIKRYGSFRVASFAFLFVIIAGVALAVFYVFSSGLLSEAHTRNNALPTPTASPISPAPR